MTADHWTPKEQRSRDKWRSALAKIQYEESLSPAELTVKMTLDPGEGVIVYRTTEEYEKALREAIENEISAPKVQTETDQEIAIKSAQWIGDNMAQQLKGFISFSKKKK